MVEPSSTIKLYSGIPLDNSYNNTLYFASESAQTSYFSTTPLLKYNVHPNTYQRVNKGTLRIGLKADNCYNCNYMAFQNTEYNTKWFYAFILNVEYVNENTCEITYEIDEIQTWFYGCTLLPSYVEREHASTDNLGDNIIEEGLPLGEIIYSQPINSGRFNNWGVMVASPYGYDASTGKIPEGETEKLSKGRIIENVYSGINYIYFYSESSVELASNVNTYVNSLGEDGRTNLVGIYMYPHSFITNSPTYKGIVNHIFSKTVTIQYDDKVGNYSPNNKKLLCYPYNFLRVTGFNGDSTDYRYEFFLNENTPGSCFFTLSGEPSPNTEFLCVPDFYGKTGKIGTNTNYSYSARISNMPMCTMNIDSYNVWLAQNKTKLLVNTGTSLFNGFSNLAFSSANTALNLASSSTYGGAGASLINGARSQSQIKRNMLGSVLNTIATMDTMQHQNSVVGGNSGSGLSITKNVLDFNFIKCNITEQYAKVIDDYFSMFGYATRKVKVPNICARNRWTYTKTVGCNIKGPCPASSLQVLSRIFDNGITFWRSTDVGNYVLTDNAPL